MGSVDVHGWDELDLDAVCATLKAVAFDLDGTLARSRKPMIPAMTERFSAMTRLLPVAVVTGGRYELVVSQILDVLGDDADLDHLHLMPTRGTRYYRWDGAGWRCEYSFDLSDEDRARAVESLRRHAVEQGVWLEHVWGNRIEDRGSQLTFSALGQQAPVEVRERWDPDNGKKNRLARAVAADLPELEVRAGGTTSVDISLKGFDKAYAMRTLASMLDIQVGQIMFVGDRMSPDGNDYPAAQAGATAVRVGGPQDTIRLCDGIIARLTRP